MSELDTPALASPVTKKASRMNDSAAALDTSQEIPEAPPSETRPKPLRGFAAMSAEKRKAISAKGGATAHANGTAHRFSGDAAKAAGRKGGSAPHRSRGPLPKAPGASNRDRQ